MSAATILLCEDDCDLRVELAELLQADGYDVTQCAGLAEAMAIAQRRTFAAVITDLALPDGCGLDLLRACHQQVGPSHAAMRILITGHGGIERMGTEKNNDFHALLVKPFDVRNLLTLLGDGDGAS
jgi:DNA-binding NtrC family response regulator